MDGSVTSLRRKTALEGCGAREERWWLGLVVVVVETVYKKGLIRKILRFAAKQWGEIIQMR